MGDAFRQVAGIDEDECGAVLANQAGNAVQYVTELFGANRPFLALLRPDNYLALLSSDLSLNAVRAYLSQNIGI